MCCSTPAAQTLHARACEFNPGDWTASVIAVTGGATQSNQQLGGGGNPAAHRMMTHTFPGPSQIAVFHQFVGAIYNPATQGEILSLDYAEDHIEFNPPFGGAAIGASPALLQSGVVFFGPDLTFTTTAWTSVSLTNDRLQHRAFREIPAAGPRCHSHHCGSDRLVVACRSESQIESLNTRNQTR